MRKGQARQNGQDRQNGASPASHRADAQFVAKHTGKQIAEAKKHGAFFNLYHAQLIVVGKVSKSESGIEIEIEPGPGALPGFDGTAHTDWNLSPTRFLYVNKRFGKKYDSYSVGAGVPDADLEKTPYLLAHGFGEDRIYFGPATEDVLKVAKIAIAQRKHDEAALLKQANENPASHPLFKAIRSGKSLATVEVVDDMAGSISIDRAGNVETQGEITEANTHIVMHNANLRGKLPKDASVGAYLFVAKPLPLAEPRRPMSSEPLIVVWDLMKYKRGTRASASYAITMNEATLRIAAAAMKRDYKRLALVAQGPQQGSSRGWNPDEGGAPGGEPEADPG